MAIVIVSVSFLEKKVEADIFPLDLALSFPRGVAPGPPAEAPQLPVCSLGRDRVPSTSAFRLPCPLQEPGTRGSAVQGTEMKHIFISQQRNI